MIIQTIGQGFFERAVSSLAFSHDSSLLVGMGCDDYHLMGIFAVSTGQKLIHIAVSHSLPPCVRTITHHHKSMNHCRSC